MVLKKFLPLVLASFMLATPLYAESIVAQGVAGDMDSHSRCPVLTVSTERGDNTVKILADAFLQSPGLRKYPLRFDFFVNRKLFSSQFRSPELPGAVGIDVGADVAAVPFNYSVVVTVIHPNRNFTSVVQGAVYESELTKNYNCSATYVDDDEELTFKDESAEAIQTSDNSFSFDFGGISTETSAQLTVKCTVPTLPDSTSSTSASVTYGNEIKNVTLSVNYTKVDENITSFELKSPDDSLVIKCE